jgi:hypothetical protein
MPPRWLPNWQDPTQYPDPAQASRVDWAWEFLRRNPVYQKHVRNVLKRTPIGVSVQRVYDRQRPDLHEYTGNYNLTPFRAQFGIITVPPNPSDPKARLRFAAEIIRYAQKPLNRQGKPPGWTYNVPTKLQDHELLVWFNLRWPMEAQLKSVKQLLEQQINETIPEGDRFQFRFRPKQYVSYLRLLDAKESGAKNKQVAQVLYPRIANIHANPEGKRRVRRDYAIAKRLRDNPWRIAAGGK